MKMRSLVLIACSTLLVACGDDKSNPTPDTSTQPDTTQPDGTQPDGTQPDTTQPDTTQPDTTQPDGTQPDGTEPDTTQPDGTQPDGTQPDGTEPDGTQPDGTTPTCTHNGFTSVAQDLKYVQSWGVAMLLAQSTLETPFNTLSIEIVDGGGLTGPGTYTLGGTNFEDCSNCVSGYRDCNDDLSCDKSFFIQSGTLVVTEWPFGDGTDTKAVGTLEDAVLVEWDIDADAAVENGETWCIDSFAIDAVPQD